MISVGWSLEGIVSVVSVYMSLVGCRIYQEIDIMSILFLVTLLFLLWYQMQSRRSELVKLRDVASDEYESMLPQIILSNFAIILHRKIEISIYNFFSCYRRILIRSTRRHKSVSLPLLPTSKYKTDKAHAQFCPEAIIELFTDTNV